LGLKLFAFISLTLIYQLWCYCRSMGRKLLLAT